MTCEDFNRYDDPKRAAAVLWEYRLELYARGLGVAVQSAVMDSRTSLELERRLDTILTIDRLNHCVSSDQFPPGIDWDATGAYANAVRIFEEQQ